MARERKRMRETLRRKLYVKEHYKGNSQREVKKKKAPKLVVICRMNEVKQINKRCGRIRPIWPFPSLNHQVSELSLTFIFQ